MVSTPFISRKLYTIPLVPKEIEYKRRLPSRYSEQIKELRKELASLVETSWLSVHREILDEDNYESRFHGRRLKEIFNPIDARLSRLLERLQNYQLMLQAQANKLSFKFQRNVLTALLYNKNFDTFDIAREANVDFDDLKNQLIRAYETLEVLNDKTRERIDNHIDIIKESISKIISDINESRNLNVNDILPLSLLKRSRHIAKLSTENDKKRRELFSLLNQFKENLNRFLNDKEITFVPSNEGGIEIKKDRMPIDVSELSSGEKQIFILLAETLLQERRNAIFLADEPELSLHIDWQQKLLSSIRSINPKAQMIVATHSPEIAGNWGHRLIDMEDVLS